MTLNEAKDIATKKITYGEYSSFEVIESFASMTIAYNIISVILEEAAELYCQSQKAQAWEEGRKMSLKYAYYANKNPVNPYLETKKRLEL